ncbi:unnamed protein product [Protopolystoma xenopodis]|uniref:Uncharacterized protein n=1 Tax=Protopolystoma xenopodis TaxID=117903 RepID=A0A448XSV9_9PLAT|nr:unnamed protein product [Protopolystoma xenopodis]
MLYALFQVASTNLTHISTSNRIEKPSNGYDHSSSCSSIPVVFFNVPTMSLSILAQFWNFGGGPIIWTFGLSTCRTSYPNVLVDPFFLLSLALVDTQTRTDIASSACLVSADRCPHTLFPGPPQSHFSLSTCPTFCLLFFTWTSTSRHEIGR